MTQDEETQRLRRRIEDRTNRPITDLRPYARGQNANLYLVDLDDQRRLMVKSIRTGADENIDTTLEAEGWMLEYLQRKTALPVPGLYWYDKTTILMDFIQDSSATDDAVHDHAAECIAALHTIHNDFFGLERDTAIGPFLQPNHFEVDWRVFFRDHRLLYMARKCRDDGVIDGAMMRKIEAIATRLDQWITSRVRPSLVHGDLWGGNILIGPGRISAFLDPAIYFADPEMELAAIRYFHTFGDRFFDRYHQIHPMRPGFDEVRRHIYSLYPILVHLRHFGASTAAAGHLQTVVDRFGASG